MRQAWFAGLAALVGVSGAMGETASGRVVNTDGQPVARVAVGVLLGGFVMPGSPRRAPLVSEFRGNERYTAVTDAQGRYTVDLPPPRKNVYFTVRPRQADVRWVRGGDVNAAPQGGSVADELVVEVFRSKMAGWVVDQRGQAIEHAIVLAPGYFHDPLVYSDATGRFELPCLPDTQVRVIALVGDDRRGEAEARGDRRDTRLTIDRTVDLTAEPAAGELKRYEALCLDLAQRLMGDPHSPAWQVPSLLSVVDRPAAWELAKGIKDEEFRDVARMALVLTTLAHEPEEAFADLDRVGEFERAGYRNATMAWLAALLAAKHPLEAAKLRDQALGYRKGLGKEPNATKLDILFLSVALELGQAGEVQRLIPAVASGIGEAGDQHWGTLADLAGWLAGGHPEAAQALVAQVTDPRRARRVEMLSWRRLAQQDPAAAAAAFTARYPKATDPGRGTDSVWYRSCMATAETIVASLAPRDSRAAARFAATLPPSEQAHLATVLAGAAADPAALKQAQTTLFRDALTVRSYTVDDPRLGQVRVRGDRDVNAAADAARSVALVDPELGRRMFEELLTPTVQAGIHSNLACKIWERLAIFSPNAAWVQTERWLGISETAGTEPAALTEAAAGLAQNDFRRAVEVVEFMARRYDPAHQGNVLIALDHLAAWIWMSPKDRRELRWEARFQRELIDPLDLS